MKTLLLSLSLILSLSTYSQSWQFARTYGGSDGGPSNKHDFNLPVSMEMDEEGNIYVFGQYGIGTSMQDSTFIYFDNSSGNFVAKYNCQGDIVWFKVLSQTGGSSQDAIHMQLKDDYLYLAGNFKVDNRKIWFLDTLVSGGILQLYPSTWEYPWIMNENYTYFIKMDLDGNIMDLNLLNKEGTPLSRAESTQISYTDRPFIIDNDNNIIISTWFKKNYSTDLNVNDQVLETIYDPEHADQILKFDEDFNLIWHKQLVESVSDPDNYAVNIIIKDMQVDSQNNIYITGQISTFNDQDTETFPTYINLGNGQQIETFFNGSYVGFVLKMNPEGEVLWVKQAKHYGPPTTPTSYGGESFFKSILISEDDHIYINGFCTSRYPNHDERSTIFGVSDTISNLKTKVDFVLKYDSQGNYKWIKPIIGTRGDGASNIVLYNDTLYGLSGWPTELQFGDSLYAETDNQNAGFAILKWDTAGNELGSSIIRTQTYHYSFAPKAKHLRMNNNGDMALCGMFDTELIMGADTLNASYQVRPFVARYGEFCTPVGLSPKAKKQKQGFSLMPNPAGDYVAIINSELGMMNVELYNLTGQLVKTKTLVRERKIDISDLKSGLYLVKVGSQTEKLLVE